MRAPERATGPVGAALGAAAATGEKTGLSGVQKCTQCHDGRNRLGVLSVDITNTQYEDSHGCKSSRQPRAKCDLHPRQPEMVSGTRSQCACLEDQTCRKYRKDAQGSERSSRGNHPKEPTARQP
eukprot:6214462-Pleurochrysis_carterae.AAC.6